MPLAILFPLLGLLPHEIRVIAEHRVDPRQCHLHSISSLSDRDGDGLRDLLLGGVRGGEPFLCSVSSATGRTLVDWSALLTDFDEHFLVRGVGSGREESILCLAYRAPVDWERGATAEALWLSPSKPELVARQELGTGVGRGWHCRVSHREGEARDLFVLPRVELPAESGEEEPDALLVHLRADRSTTTETIPGTTDVWHVRIAPAWDVDGDGWQDVAISALERDRSSPLRLLSAAPGRAVTERLLFERRFESLDGVKSRAVGISLAGGADVSGDGLFDVLVGEADLSQTPVRVLRAEGDATTPRIAPTPIRLAGMSWSFASELALVDVEGDGLFEIVVADDDHDREGGSQERITDMGLIQVVDRNGRVLAESTGGSSLYRLGTGIEVLQPSPSEERGVVIAALAYDGFRVIELKRE